jgi:glycosyltransferase involved in cell wall biosynthesis
MKKILFLIEALSSGGAERQTFYLLNKLNKNKFKIFLITWQDKNFYCEEDLKEITWLKFERKSRFDFSLIMKIRSLIKENEIEVVYGILNSGNLYACLSTFFSKTKFVASERSSKRKLPWQVFIHKFFCHNIADFNIANSNAGRDFLVYFGVKSSKIKVINNFRDLDKFKAIHPSFKNEFKEKLGFHKKYLILCVARLTPLKNQIGILNSFAEFDFRNDSSLCFLGTSEFNYKEILLSKIIELNLQNHVVIIEPVQNVEEFYWAADISLLFSDFEGSPNTPMESLACGTPVISSNVGDVSNYIIADKTGWVIDSRNEVQLKNCLNQYFVLSPERRFEISLDCPNTYQIKQSDSNLISKEFEVIFSNI